MTELKAETYQKHDIPPTAKANLLKKEDSKNLVLINWIEVLFSAFIPTLVLFLIKKDDEFVQSHVKKAPSFNIANVILTVICIILTITVILSFLSAIIMTVMAIAWLIFCIMGAVKGYAGETFHIPYNKSFIK